MSLRSAFPSIALAILGVLLLPSTVAAQDPFDCFDPTDHCLAQERDNMTFYLDTDGTMNLSAGGGMSYWQAATDTLREIAQDNHISGMCMTGMGNSCRPAGCDEIRIGLGYYGDDSIVAPETTTLNAYRAVPAGEDKRTDVLRSLDGYMSRPAENAGNVGLQGVETLGCPATGAGQVDIISCPPMGSQQIERITCPPNGGFQTNEITVPAMGVKQVNYVQCPPNGVSQVSTYTPYMWTLSLPPSTTYTVNVGGNVISTFVLFGEVPLLIAGRLYTAATMNAAITNDYNVSISGATLRFERKSVGVPFSLTASPVGYFYIAPPFPAAVAGLPTTPTPSNEFKFRINSSDVKFDGNNMETTASVCTRMETEVNLLTGSTNVEASYSGSGSTLVLTSTVPGDSFSVSSFSGGMVNLGTVVANVNGLPSTPSSGYEFDFRVNGNKRTHDHIGNAETTRNVCEKLRDSVNAVGPANNVSASCPGPAYNKVVITSTLAGQSFTISNVDSQLSNMMTIANAAGLPGTPAPGYSYNFQLGTPGMTTTTIAHTGTTTSSTASVCTAIRDQIVASGHPVTTVLGPNYVDISATSPGMPFTISGVPGALTRTVTAAGSVGLPGTPGATHTYTWDYTDVDNVTTTITAPPPATLTTAGVCASITAALVAHPAFNATTTGTSVTVTPTDPGAVWNFSNFSASNVSRTTSRSGLAASPGPYHDYSFTIDGINVTYTDDGSPTQAEICAGVRARIQAVASTKVTATQDTLNVTMTGLTSAPFVIANIDSYLNPHVVVVPAGLGPAAYSDLGQRIQADMDIATRTQNAVVITHRPPDNYADFAAGITAICARRDDPTAPARTHVIGLGLTSTERQMLNVMAAAGGTGSCAGGVDPCVTAAFSTTLTPLVSCSGSIGASASTLKARINDIINVASCTLDLAVPPSYAGGKAPNDPNVIFVQIREWDIYDIDAYAEVFRYDTNDAEDWAHYLRDREVGHNNPAHDYDDAGWFLVPGDFSKLTFTGQLCRQIREGKITKIRTEVGCQCPNQGEECTATTALMCKNPNDLSGPLITCTADQLANMRCATGVYICSNGVQECSAMGTNTMPELCNGVDDDCDGIIDNMSNGTIAQFQGREPEGRHCNFKDVCMCPDGAKDTSALGGIDEHLDSWTGDCQCGEGLELNYTPSPYGVIADESKPTAGDRADFGSDDAACSVGMNSRGGGFLVLGLLGFIGLARRRRRR